MTVHLLEWLVHKEDQLAQFVAHNFTQRHLAVSAHVARDAFASLKDRCSRRIDYELLARSLYLFHFAKDIENISDNRHFLDAVEKAIRQ